MDEQRWLDAVQETMLVVLAICRVLISREHFTVEKSGIILIITIVNSADLLTLSHLLQYHDVIIERLWMYIGLVLLTIGLFQFAFIDTDGLTHSSNRTSLSLSTKRRFSKRIHFLQDQRLFPLFRVRVHRLKSNNLYSNILFLGFIYQRWSPFTLSNSISH